MFFQALATFQAVFDEPRTNIPSQEHIHRKDEHYHGEHDKDDNQLIVPCETCCQQFRGDACVFSYVRLGKICLKSILK